MINTEPLNSRMTHMTTTARVLNLNSCVAKAPVLYTLGIGVLGSAASCLEGRAADCIVAGYKVG